MDALEVHAKMHPLTILRTKFHHLNAFEAEQNHLGNSDKRSVGQAYTN